MPDWSDVIVVSETLGGERDVYMRHHFRKRSDIVRDFIIGYYWKDFVRIWERLNSCFKVERNEFWQMSNVKGVELKVTDRWIVENQQLEWASHTGPSRYPSWGAGNIMGGAFKFFFRFKADSLATWKTWLKSAYNVYLINSSFRWGHTPMRTRQ